MARARGVKGRRAFRFWFYLRQGWSTYVAFAVTMVNTVTLTYYLAVENYPALGALFPSFGQYALTVVSATVPLVALVGYIHYKKSRSFRSDMDVIVESNPYASRVQKNSETVLGLNLEILRLVARMSEGGRVTEEERARIARIQSELEKYMKERPEDIKSMSTVFDER